MPSVITIIIAIIAAVIGIVATVLVIVLGMKKPQPDSNTYVYGPNMYSLRKLFPVALDSSGRQPIFNGLIPIPASSTTPPAPGYDVFDPIHTYIDPSVSDVIFSTSGWATKAFYNNAVFNVDLNKVVHNNLPISNGLFWLISGKNGSDPNFPTQLYYYNYTIPYSGFFNPTSFPGSVNNCGDPAQAYKTADYHYRQIGLGSDVVTSSFFSPILRSTIDHKPLNPDQVTFSVISENGSEFTSTLIYRDISNPTNHYVNITLSKLIPYIVVKFKGAIFINASSDPNLSNFLPIPAAKVFNFYDSRSYHQPTGIITEPNITRFSLSEGNGVLTYFSCSSAVTVTTQIDTGATTNMYCVIDSGTTEITMIVAPLSISATSGVYNGVQIASRNPADCMVMLNEAILPTPENGVTSIRCTGLTLNNNDFTLDYEAETNSTAGFIFVPYIGMLTKDHSIEGAAPTTDTSIYSTGHNVTPVYITTSNKFSIRHPYLSVPDYTYDNLTTNKAALDDALSLDMTSAGVYLPRALGVDKDNSDDSYNFGKEIFNFAQMAWIANSVGSASYPSVLAVLQDQLNKVLNMSLPSTASYDDPPNFPSPNLTSNILLTFAYNPRLKMLSLLDNVAGSSYGHGYGNDHVIHEGYIIYAIYIYLTLVNSAAEDAKFNKYVLMLMRDVAQPYNDDDYFPRMRHFDFALCASWLSGVGDRDNTESCSEVINGYYACYLMAQRLGDARLVKFYRAILTLEIKTNQELRFPGIGDQTSNLLAQLLRRNDTLLQKSGAASSDTPPSNILKFGFLTQIKVQDLSANTLFGANAIADVPFIMFLPFSPITTLWWNKSIGQYVAGQIHQGLQSTLDYYNGTSNLVPDVTVNNTNILIFSAFYEAAGWHYKNSTDTHGNPSVLVFPPPIYNANMGTVLEYMSYAYNTSIKQYIFNSANLIQKHYGSQTCGVISPNTALTTALVNPQYYGKISLDNGASNTVIRAAILAIEKLIA